MATKAERFKSAAERKGPRPGTRSKTPRGPGMRSQSVDTSKPGVSADDRRWGADSTGARNRSKHAEQKATYGYEDSNADTSRASRKSTRAGSRHHIKPDNPLKARVVLRNAAPSTRAAQQKRVRGRRPVATRG